MRILNWNCRGLGKSFAVQQCKKISLESKPAIIFLIETRLVQGKGSIIWEKCGFAEGWELPREGLSGGLLLAWLPQLQLHIYYESKHLVHTNLVDNQGNPLSITFVYGNLEMSKREEVWNKLRSLKLLAHPTIKLVLSYLRVAQVFSYQTN